MAFIQEFKEFVMRGNVVDMAVGIVIGAAFGKIVTSFVGDIIMPPVSLLMGNINFSNLKYVLRETTTPTGEPSVISINYGQFIQTTIDFLIVAAAIFLVIQCINKLKRKQAEQAVIAPPAPTASEVLLQEIRDLLKEKRA